MSYPGWFNWILDFLEARPSGKGWKARCPAHEDRNPSLSLWLGDKGVLIVRCKAGCPLPDVLSKVGLTMSNLFPPDENNAYAKTGQRLKEEPRRKPVAWYDYTDEDGKLLYQVVRTEPKGFYQRKPEPSSKDGWYPGLGDVRRVLFHLPLIVESSVAPVVVVEGERDVLSLEALGFVATCNCGGVGMGWRQDYSMSLRGRRVVVIADNDTAGREHAERVVGSLMRCGAESTRLVELPGMPEHGDVTAFIEKHGGAAKEELIRVIRSHSEWKRACGVVDTKAG